MARSPTQAKFTAIYMIATTFGEYLANFYDSETNNIRTGIMDDGYFALIFDPAKDEPTQEAKIREEFFADLAYIINSTFSESFAVSTTQKAIQTKDMNDFMLILRTMHETFAEQNKQEIKEALKLPAEDILPGNAKVNIAEKPYLLNGLQKESYISISQIYADIVAYEALDGDDELYAYCQTYSFEQIENAIATYKTLKQNAPPPQQSFYIH